MVSLTFRCVLPPKTEVERFDESRALYETAAIKTHVTLGYLNSGQSVIFTTGLVLKTP